MCKKFLITIIAFLSSLMVEASEILVEAESFHQKGGWVVDQQFMDQMGSSYLLAHGMGKPVDDATTTIHVKEGGLYYIYVRTIGLLLGAKSLGQVAFLCLLMEKSFLRYWALKERTGNGKKLVK